METTNAEQDAKVPQALIDAVYVKTTQTALQVGGETREEVHGYDFNKGIDYEQIFKSYRHTGF